MSRLTWALGTMIGPLIGVCQHLISSGSTNQMTRRCSIIFMALVLVVEPSFLRNRPRHGATSRESCSSNQQAPCRYGTSSCGLARCHTIHQWSHQLPCRSLFRRHKLSLAVISDTTATDYWCRYDHLLSCLGGSMG